MSHFCKQAMFERPSVLEEGYDRLLGCFSRSSLASEAQRLHCLTAFSRPFNHMYTTRPAWQQAANHLFFPSQRNFPGRWWARAKGAVCFTASAHTCLPAYRSHPAQQHGPHACKPTVPKVHQTTLLQL